jgi:hypothetical protein
MCPSRSGPSRCHRKPERPRQCIRRIVGANARRARGLLNDRLEQQRPKLSEIPLVSQADETATATGGRETHFDEVLVDAEIGFERTTTHGSIVGYECTREQTG